MYSEFLSEVYLIVGDDSFQFPSNGKVYSEYRGRVARRPRAVVGFNSLQTGKCIQSVSITVHPESMRVSIPFKRESVFREVLREARIFSLISVSIPFKRESVFRACWMTLTVATLSRSFNSLQTGKCIQRLKMKKKAASLSQQVSIPFKRESVFRGKKLSLGLTSSNVSIPFKRESVFREKRIVNLERLAEFQFPSNGKVYSENISLSNSRE